MTTLITSDNRAIDFDHVRMVDDRGGDCVFAVFTNGDQADLFTVSGHTNDEIADLVARVTAHCMENTADIVVLEDAILKEWRYCMETAKEKKDD